MPDTKKVLIIHYNTPYLTECLVRSVNHFVKDATIYIFDNSTDKPFTAKFDNVTLLDNTKGQYVNFHEWLKKYPNRVKSGGKVNLWASAKHCYSVEICMDIIKDNFVLLDSDVLIKKDFSNLYKEDMIFVGEVENQKDVRYSIKRLLPYICFINYKLCKQHGIHYFYEDYMHGLGPSDKNKQCDSYDTGAGFYFHAKSYSHMLVKINDYMVHFGNGSWDKKFKRKTVKPEQWALSHKKLWSDGKNKKVVYTCITDGYDTLSDPEYINGDFDYICFTNTSGFTSNIWDLRPLPQEVEGLSQVKKQRYVKINAHKLLSNYDISIWVDGSVDIRGNLNTLLDKYVNKSSEAIFVPKHPKRDCIYDESNAVIAARKDKSEIVNPIMDRYKKEGFPKKYGLLQSNIMIRKHNDERCIKLMEAWFAELKDNSHRDQLSFNYVCWKNPDIGVVYMDKMIYDSEWFKWNMHKKFANKLIVHTHLKRGSVAIEESKKKLEELRKKRIESMKAMNEKMSILHGGY